MKNIMVLSALVLGCLLAWPGSAAAEDAITTGDLNMRAGPGTEYPRIVTIPEGGHVYVHGCTSGYGWCDVSWSAYRGWVYSGYLAFLYDNRYVVGPRYGAVVGVPIITFSFGDYWYRHYRRYPWYYERRYWRHTPPPPPPRVRRDRPLWGDPRPVLPGPRPLPLPR